MSIFSTSIMSPILIIISFIIGIIYIIFKELYIKHVKYKIIESFKKGKINDFYNYVLKLGVGEFRKLMGFLTICDKTHLSFKLIELNLKIIFNREYFIIENDNLKIMIDQKSIKFLDPLNIQILERDKSNYIDFKKENCIIDNYINIYLDFCKYMKKYLLR